MYLINRDNNRIVTMTDVKSGTRVEIKPGGEFEISEKLYESLKPFIVMFKLKVSEESLKAKRVANRAVKRDKSTETESKTKVKPVRKMTPVRKRSSSKGKTAKKSNTQVEKVDESLTVGTEDISYLTK